MSSNSSNSLFSQSDILFAKPYLKNIPISSKDSPLPIEFEEKNNKNLKYCPIVSKHSFTGKKIIYLGTGDNDNDNKHINNSSSKKNIDNYSKKKVKKKSKNKQKLFMQQRSIEFQIKKTKFEYILNLPVKNESKNNDKEKSNNEVNKKNEEIYSIKEETEEENKNNNYKNIKDDFMATTKKLFEKEKKRKNKNLNHSYSVENYSGFLNKDFLSNFTDNIQNLENSKIMENNFIEKFKNTNRKNNLMELLEKYKRFKSYSHRIKISDPLNKSFTSGFSRNKYRQKSTEKVYDIKNIIEEDENENSENETLKLKVNSKITDKAKDNKYNILENKEKKIIKKSKEEIILAEKLKEIKSKRNFQNALDDEIDNDKNENENDLNSDDIDKDKLPNINHNNDIEIIHSIDETNTNNNNNEINMDKYKNNYKSNNANNDKEIDINKIYFDSNNTNRENWKEKRYKKYNKNNDIKNDITKEQKENYDPNSNIINRINNIKKKIDNNICKNINCTKAKKKNNNQEILVRKILREERYIIDENGQEKVLEVNQSLLNNNNIFKFVVKNRRNKDSIRSINCITNNYTTNLDEKILTKEKHLGKNHKILITEKNLDTIDTQNKNPKIKVESSFKNSSRVANDILKRKYTCASSVTSFYKNAQSKTTQNSQEKENEIFKNINISKINKPIFIQRIDKITKNNLNDNKINDKNIDNNNSNQVFYYQNQISPSLSPNYRKYYNSKIELRKKLGKNNNHSYHEITSINRRKNSLTSKTIFQDYRNYDKGVSPHKSTASLNNMHKNIKLNGNILGRNLTSYNFQKQIPNSNSKLIQNNYNRDEPSKNRKKFSNERIITESYFKYCRNIIKDENKNNFQKRRNPTENNRDMINNDSKSITSTKYINSISKNIPKFQSFRLHNKNLGQSMSSIYHENVINRLNKVHLELKSSFSSNNFNYIIDDRRQKVVK